MKHIIFSDIDGTIYPRTKEIHPQTIKDIQMAQSKNIEFVLSTGNAYLDNVARLAKKLNVRYCITSNGASIYDRTEKQFIYEAPLSKEIVQKLVDFSLENKITTIWWDKEKIYFNKFIKEETIKLIEGAITDDKNHEISDGIVKNDVYKIEFYDDPKKIDLISDFIKQFNLQQARMKDIHVEVTANNVSKGSAVKWLVKYLNLDINNTMAIGDSANDLSMFEVVNHSYVMDNASRLVKEKAKHYTSDVIQNGLGEAIIDFMYREKLDR